MIRRLALASLIALFPAIASAQFATIGPTPPVTDNGDRLATTAWVNQFFALGLPLASDNIFIGSAAGLATQQTVSGDATLSNSGVLTLATVNANTGAIGSATQCVTVTNNAKGLTTAVSAVTCTPAIGSVTGLATGVAAFLATPTSANLAAAVTNETGSGLLVFGTSPNITTPTGIVKGDVGLGNVANVDTTNATNISTGTLANGLSAATHLAAGNVNGGVTGTLPVANGGTGDTGTAWIAFTPSPSCGTATFTVTSARSKTQGKTTFVEVDITIASIGTCANLWSWTLPNTAQSGGGFAGRETNVNGKTIACAFAGGTNAANCSMADASSFVVTNRMIVSGVYENQ